MKLYSKGHRLNMTSAVNALHRNAYQTQRKVSEERFSEVQPNK